jgi:serine/threonine-protein kinase
VTAELSAADVSLATAAGTAVDIGTSVALSPDGTLLVFAGQRDSDLPQLYVRRLDQLQATPLPGTEGAASPFFSPDGRWIAFFANDRLKKIAVTGGAAVTLCDAPRGRGGSWSEDGMIIFTPGAVQGQIFLMRVSSAGGTPEPVAAPGDGEVTQRWPQVLPGGKAVLYTGNTVTGGYENANLVVQELPGGPRKVVQAGGYYGRYLRSGHLVYVHSGTLFAAPFDLTRLEATGQPVPVVEGVTSNPSIGSTQFAVSDTGLLVYLPGPGTEENPALSWLNHSGNIAPLRSATANWSNPHVSPDGGRLAIDIDNGQTDVFVYEWARDTMTRVTFDAARDEKPVWTPDGRRIVFASSRDNNVLNLYWQHADGSGEVQRLAESPNLQTPASWHPSGKFLAFTEIRPQTLMDLMILPVEGDEASGWKPGKPTVFLSTPFVEVEPMFSPDGRWIAYHSAESLRNEVYVRPFPGPGGKWQISTEGGVNPAWSITRPEIVFQTPDLRLMVASYSTEGEVFKADKPRVWSERRLIGRPRQRSFDLHPDGERVAVAVASEVENVDVKQDKLVFIVNFFDELRRIAPVATR